MLRFVIPPVLVLALIGLAASVFVLVLGVVGKEQQLGVVQAVLIGCLVLVMVPLVLIANSSQAPARGRRWDALYKGCPVWMRRLTYALAILGTVGFFGSMLLEQFGKLPSPGRDEFPGITFGSFGVVAFSAMFSQLYSALQMDKLRQSRSCPNGHEVDLDSRFCRECGAKIEGPMLVGEDGG